MAICGVGALEGHTARSVVVVGGRARASSDSAEWASSGGRACGQDEVAYYQTGRSSFEQTVLYSDFSKTSVTRFQNLNSGKNRNVQPVF